MIDDVDIIIVVCVIVAPDPYQMTGRKALLKLLFWLLIIDWPRIQALNTLPTPLTYHPVTSIKQQQQRYYWWYTPDDSQTLTIVNGNPVLLIGDGPDILYCWLLCVRPLMMTSIPYTLAVTLGVDLTNHTPRPHGVFGENLVKTPMTIIIRPEVYCWTLDQITADTIPLNQLFNDYCTDHSVIYYSRASCWHYPLLLCQNAAALLRAGEDILMTYCYYCGYYWWPTDGRKTLFSDHYCRCVCIILLLFNCTEGKEELQCYAGELLLWWTPLYSSLFIDWDREERDNVLLTILQWLLDQNPASPSPPRPQLTFCYSCHPATLPPPQQHDEWLWWMMCSARCSA